MIKTINTIRVRVGQFFGALQSMSVDEATGGQPCKSVGGSYC